MIKQNILPIFFLLAFYACGQNSNSKNTDNIIVSKENSNDTFHGTQSWKDTSVIAILPIDTIYHWLFENAKPLNLTEKDLQTVDNILADCIKTHNAKQDTTKEFSEYIDLKKYKRQYIAFINSKGEKKVYINCFCTSDWGFDYWKKSLVHVNDGGSCFFQVTINLTTLEYEKFGTNGYA